MLSNEYQPTNIDKARTIRVYRHPGATISPTITSPRLRNGARTVQKTPGPPHKSTTTLTTRSLPPRPFDNSALHVRLYTNPITHRARILIITPTPTRHPLYHCLPLTSLKVIRNKSTLQLCRRHQGARSYYLWASSNFLLYERMVLFYSTLVALKRQDPHPLHPDLLDSSELREGEDYGGELTHGSFRHALRLFRDRGSGVLRLEASPLRGQFVDVPIWTAFLDKYRFDDAHFVWKGKGTGVVSVAALKPRPYVFCEGFELERGGDGGFVLRFASDRGKLAMRMLCRVVWGLLTWNGQMLQILCSVGRGCVGVLIEGGEVIRGYCCELLNGVQTFLTSV